LAAICGVVGCIIASMEYEDFYEETYSVPNMSNVNITSVDFSIDDYITKGHFVSSD